MASKTNKAERRLEEETLINELERAAKMLCKSIDALTREVYLMRKASEMKEQRELEKISPHPKE